ncbi:MAG: hypothetical protein AAF483_22645 [Planctomycetota bacterium]
MILQRAMHILCFLICFLGHSSLDGQEKQKVIPDTNQSKEFPNVYHSPSADSTPDPFRSIFQLELVVKQDEEAEVIYANGVLVTLDGLIVSVIDAPESRLDASDIESATVLLLDGASTELKLKKYDSAHGVAVFQSTGLKAPPMTLSTKSLVAKRRLQWHAVVQNGRKRYLYSRSLQVHKSKKAAGGIEDLCEIIDVAAHSSLNADRSGSALLALDGSLVALMGRQPHWNISPKNVLPRTKVALAVPASVIAAILD